MGKTDCQKMCIESGLVLISHHLLQSAVVFPSPPNPYTVAMNASDGRQSLTISQTIPSQPTYCVLSQPTYCVLSQLPTGHSCAPPRRRRGNIAFVITCHSIVPFDPSLRLQLTHSKDAAMGIFGILGIYSSSNTVVYNINRV